MFDRSAAKPQTRNRNRFKHLDAWIRRTMDYCQQQGIVIGSEREAYQMFKRVQELENGYATPAQEMAQISAERVKEEFGFHLFQSRWRQSTVTFRQSGKVIRLRRFLPLGPLGWRDTVATVTAANSEEDYLLLATGLLAAAEQSKEWAKQCATLMAQAEVLGEMAEQPRQLFLPSPDDESIVDEENTDDVNAE